MGRVLECRPSEGESAIASITDIIHERWVAGRRVRVLSEHLARLLPEEGLVLDVGSGDGEVARRIMEGHSSTSIEGIDVIVRPDASVPVTEYDGSHFPYADNAFDVVTFVDVLHHTTSPTELLREAARVARDSVVIKDHVLNGFLAEPTLRLMDTVGNTRHGVALPFNYLSEDEWSASFLASGLTVASWENRLGIYPFPATLLFDRKLHFVARLMVRR
jgi:SAM-dependent methyltransferase